jgi:DNA-binding transcriptional LysR family regulator
MLSTHPLDSDVASLRARVDGAVVLPGDDGWDAARQAWNLAADQRPTLVALPASAGAMREFWLAAEHRTTPARVSAEASTADEAFEAVAAGSGVALLSAGNAALYQCDDVVCRPVPDLPPCRLAVMWRSNDRRRVVRVVAGTCCRCVAADQPAAAVAT